MKPNPTKNFKNSIKTETGHFRPAPGPAPAFAVVLCWAGPGLALAWACNIRPKKIQIQACLLCPTLQGSVYNLPAFWQARCLHLRLNNINLSLYIFFVAVSCLQGIFFAYFFRWTANLVKFPPLSKKKPLPPCPLPLSVIL